MIYRIGQEPKGLLNIEVTQQLKGAGTLPAGKSDVLLKRLQAVTL